jgi:uncharacterized protein (DUF1810 family)
LESFVRAQADDFEVALALMDRYYLGQPDERTLELLSAIDNV